MAIIIPETIFKNAFVRKIHERTSRKERQQCMQQKLEKLQPMEKMFFYAGHRAPRPPLRNLANSIFFPLCFYPNTLNGFGGGKNLFSCSCLLITRFSTLFPRQLVTDLLPKGKQHFDIPHFILILLAHLNRS